MRLAGYWLTHDDELTWRLWLAGAVACVLAAAGMAGTFLLWLRRRDREQLLRERLPYSQLVMKTHEMAEWCQRAVAEQGDQLEAVGGVVSEIRSHLIDGPSGDYRPTLRIIKDV